MQISQRLREFEEHVESCSQFFSGILTAILMEANITHQAQAIFTMPPRPKAEEITIRAARVTGLIAERAAERASRFPSFCNFLASVFLVAIAVEITHEQ
jgi:hypothetical protein